MPTESYVGSMPISIDEPPIRAMVMIRTTLRPILSPMAPNTRPPIGRAAKPTA